MRTSLSAIALVAALAGCNDVPAGTVVGIQPELPNTTDDLTAVILTQAEDRHEVTYSYAWSVDGVPVDDLSTDSVPSGMTSKGQVWSVQVTPADHKVTGEVATAEVTISNSAPTAEVSIEPLAPTTLDDLKATATHSDADGDTVTLDWEWTRDGVVVPGQDRDRVPANATGKGETWEVTVTPTDGETVGVPVTASVTVGNEAPVAESVVITPDEIRTSTEAIAVATGSDPDGEELTWTYTWYVSGGEVKTDEDDWLDPGSFVKGDTLMVEARASDGSAESAIVQSEIVTVLNTAPVVEGATISPSEANRSSILTCDPIGGSDADGDPVTFTSTWNVDGREVGEHATLDGTYFRKGQTVVCTLTPTDGEDAGEPVTSDPIVIGNTPPVLGAITITPTTPYTTDTLGVTASGVTDADEDDVSLSYEWTIGGSLASSSSSLSASTHSKNDVIEVTVTPNDGEDDGTPLTATVTINNSPPTDPSVAIDPGGPGDDDDLICDVTTVSTDADGDSLTYTTTWTRNSSSWSGSTSTTVYPGDTIDASDTALKDEWSCTVTVSDGTDSSSPVTSSTVTVADSKDFTLFTTRQFIKSGTSLSSRTAANAKCASEASALGISGTNWKIVYSTATEDAKDYVDYDASRGDRVYDKSGTRIDGGDLWNTSRRVTLSDLKSWTITGTGKAGTYKTCSGSYTPGSWPICQYCSRKFTCASSSDDPFDGGSCCWTGTRAVLCMGER